MLRTKVNPDGSFNENSYNSTDEVNNIKWDTLENEVYADVVDYYKGLIDEVRISKGVLPVEDMMYADWIGRPFRVIVR